MPDQVIGDFQHQLKRAFDLRVNQIQSVSGAGLGVSGLLAAASGVIVSPILLLCPPLWIADMTFIAGSAGTALVGAKLLDDVHSNKIRIEKEDQEYFETELIEFKKREMRLFLEKNSYASACIGVVVGIPPLVNDEAIQPSLEPSSLE
jgi:hypothetical protein